MSFEIVLHKNMKLHYSLSSSFDFQRVDILAKLAEVQLPDSELKLLYTTSKLGTGDKQYQTKQ